ncbi:MAG TPA: 2-isopropylmalate synthase [Bacteroidetes bacterium]|nr:2-isopropylmalate synthase [Bacteroidota bacterium]
MVEIMDTTLRDGEQTSGVSFHPREKLQVARILLDELGVHRVEVGSARVSSGEWEGVRLIAEWARKEDRINRVEVLGFIDGNISVDWARKAGVNVLNLLCKGSFRHVRQQLGKTPEQHLEDIRLSIKLARQAGITVNIYLEDWSNGMIHSPEYVYYLTDHLVNEDIRRIMLPDTLGILNPDQTGMFCQNMTERYPEVHFDFHAHNDYDLAVANVYAALKHGMRGIHTTVNGLGERAGNACLSSVIGIMKDQLKQEVPVNESVLTPLSRIVESFSGIRIPPNQPLIGENVFTQTCGVHADGDAKNNLYYNDLLPERFGRIRKYALGKTSGKASIRKNLEELGLDPDEETLKKLTRRVIELGDKKQYVTTGDLPYILADVMGNGEADPPVSIRHYVLSLSRGLRPSANISLSVNGSEYEENATGDGQYDAFMNALWKIYEKLGRDHPRLLDYVVTIPPGGKPDALVETIITWAYRGREFKTRAVDSDQTEAAIQATVKALNLMEKLNDK